MSERAVFEFKDGGKITVWVAGNALQIHGSGTGIGKLSIDPEGGNRLKIRVVE